MKAIASLSPRVCLFVFDSSQSFNYLMDVYDNIFVINDFVYDLTFHWWLNSSNPFQTPFFSSIMTITERLMDSSFYGYINGDILVPEYILTILQYIQTQQTNQILQQKAYLPPSISYLGHVNWSSNKYDCLSRYTSFFEQYNSLQSTVWFLLGEKGTLHYSCSSIDSNTTSIDRISSSIHNLHWIMKS